MRVRWKRMNNCPRCHRVNVDSASYCGRCGFDLRRGAGLAPGVAPCAQPANVPAGYRAVEKAAQLYFFTSASHGGPRLLDTEGVRVSLFNAGYGLCEVALRVSGVGRDGIEQFAYEEQIASLPQGETISFEAPSHRFDNPLDELRLELLSAQYPADFTTQE